MDEKITALIIIIAVSGLILFLLSRKYKKEDGTTDWAKVWKVFGCIVFFWVVFLYILVMFVAKAGSPQKKNDDKKQKKD